MLKKRLFGILVILIAVMLVFALVGCSSNGADAPDDDNGGNGGNGGTGTFNFPYMSESYWQENSNNGIVENDEWLYIYLNVQPYQGKYFDYDGFITLHSSSVEPGTPFGFAVTVNGKVVTVEQFAMLDAGPGIRLAVYPDLDNPPNAPASVTVKVKYDKPSDPDYQLHYGNRVDGFNGVLESFGYTGAITYLP